MATAKAESSGISGADTGSSCRHELPAAKPAASHAAPSLVQLQSPDDVRLGDAPMLLAGLGIEHRAAPESSPGRPEIQWSDPVYNRQGVGRTVSRRQPAGPTRQDLAGATVAGGR